MFLIKRQYLFGVYYQQKHKKEQYTPHTQPWLVGQYDILTDITWPTYQHTTKPIMSARDSTPDRHVIITSAICRQDTSTVNISTNKIKFKKYKFIEISNQITLIGRIFFVHRWPSFSGTWPILTSRLISPTMHCDTCWQIETESRRRNRLHFSLSKNQDAFLVLRAQGCLQVSFLVFK